ncbi:L-lactate permease, partial [Amycolatopsis taiwanensis]|uniref:L-lactate permease n=1 Tax=Amycolatopsis taiwanensis TaxID=342230 RepID=UPI0025537405
MFTQILDPVHSVLGSTLLALVPVAVLLLLLAVVRLSAWQAVIGGAIVTLLGAIFIWHTPTGTAFTAYGLGAATGFWSIDWIVFWGVIIYRFRPHDRRGLPRTGNRRGDVECLGQRRAAQDRRRRGPRRETPGARGTGRTAAIAQAGGRTGEGQRLPGKSFGVLCRDAEESARFDLMVKYAGPDEPAGTTPPEGKRFSVLRMARLLSVSTSGYYAHVKRAAAAVLTPR